ncbi:hypothetical protein B9Q03_12180 [Candidatus Marsarchaeota G2 archaeon OSP_D]|jgi:membrane-bound metal-dependent hydrolase YbcI (DUF457 family)|uniref:Metal-dependent hydrolase n=1 Tax=Candidatus Marsarchaeota G2 archaeon OSP_D TaxID=1978157 RepID=A0A2R6AH01_9ARCH|nr:MAG: hypothetical protein B9Q03_12180 [Candidatus Marsarchaeota G2 archaeon OSP_D]
MLIRTHILFSFALLSVLSLALPGAQALLASSAATAVISNVLIDAAGHERRRSGGRMFIRRTPLTHTPLHSALFGAISSAPACFLLFHYSLLFQLAASPFFGALSGLSHIFLDAFTERGIYVKRNGRYERFALAHLPYNSPVNSVVAAASLFIAFACVSYAFGF